MGSTVYVSIAVPAHHGISIGGFEYFDELAGALARYYRDVAESKAEDGAWVVRLVEMNVQTPLSDALGVAAELNERAAEIGHSAPALRQFIPPVTAGYTPPTGGSAATDH